MKCGRNKQSKAKRNRNITAAAQKADRKKKKQTKREGERKTAGQTCRSQQQKQQQKKKEGATMQARGMTEVCIANKEAAQVNLSTVSETSELRRRKR